MPKTTSDQIVEKAEKVAQGSGELVTLLIQRDSEGVFIDAEGIGEVSGAAACAVLLQRLATTLTK